MRHADCYRKSLLAKPGPADSAAGRRFRTLCFRTDAMAEFSERLLIVSPHYDDAVFSCGALLAAHDDAAVVTVLTGSPAASGSPGQPDVLTAWDRDCGFRTSADAMCIREREDDAALERLGVEAIRLGFYDDQYVQAGVGAPPSREAIASAIDATIDALRATVVVMPLGLFHSDHERVHDACLSVMKRRPALKWLAYEDALYRRMPGKVQARLAGLLDHQICATPAFVHGTATGGHLSVLDAQALSKREAVAAYDSQLRAFGPSGYGDVAQPEHYWHLFADDQAAAVGA